MKKITFICFLLVSTASAQILDTTGSFAESGFCKQYGCSLKAKDQIGAGIIEYTYAVGREPKNYNPYTDENPLFIFVVRRLNNKVISGYFEYGAQDDFFTEYNKALPLYIGFIGQLTGMRPNLGQISKIERNCGTEEDGQAIVTKWKGSAISCINYPFSNARQYRYNIFKQ